MAKRIISLILVLIMLSLALMACGGDDPTKDPTAGPSGDDYADDPAADDGDSTDDLTDPADDDDDEEEDGDETKKTTLGDGIVDMKILQKLPQAQYNKKVYSIALPNSEHYKYFDAPTRNGDPENDAIYSWLKAVEKQFDVKVQITNYNVDSTAYFQTVKSDITSGQSKYNIYGHYAFMIGEFIMGECAQDWHSLEKYVDANGQKYLDISAGRWDQKLNSEVTYNGRLLSLTGDLGVSKLLSAMATFVNLTLLDEYAGVESDELYGYVENGTWTFEKFKGLVKEIYDDRGVAGKGDDDLLGYYSNTGNQGDIWFPAFDREITARDEQNNTISATFMDDPTNVSIVQELRSFYWETKEVLALGGTSPTAKFRSGELGFVSTYFVDVYGPDGFNKMTDFGIVPTPKWDTAQETYRTKLNDRYTIWCLPKSLAKAEEQFTAHITDALCAESSEVMYYKYYEEILKGRYTKDAKTKEMVDLVMLHPHFDTAIQFGTFIGSYTYMPRYLIYDMTMDIASTYDSAVNNLEAKLQEIYNCYYK